MELIKSSLGPHGMAQLRGDKLQQNGYEKTEVVNRQKIGLKLCRRNEHEAVINLRDIYLFIYSKATITKQLTLTLLFICGFLYMSQSNRLE